MSHRARDVQHVQGGHEVGLLRLVICTDGVARAHDLPHSAQGPVPPLGHPGVPHHPRHCQARLGVLSHTPPQKQVKSVQRPMSTCTMLVHLCSLSEWTVGPFPLSLRSHSETLGHLKQFQVQVSKQLLRLTNQKGTPREGCASLAMIPKAPLVLPAR